MSERYRNHPPTPRCCSVSVLKTLALLTAILGLCALPAHSQFVAFNDHMQGPGSSNYATFYTLTNAGQLREISSGVLLPVSLTVTGYVCLNNGSAAALGSGPAYDTFSSFVDFSGYTIQMGTSAGLSAHILSGLDPSCRYSLKGTANAGKAPYTNRWTLFELLGADSLRPAHSLGCLTNDPDQGISLESNQVAICTGMNTFTGAMFHWEDVIPDSAGQLTIISRKYTGPVPNGTNNLTAGVFGLGGLRLEETFRPISITRHPSGAILFPGSQHTFEVVAIGTGPVSYQWRKNGVDIPNATNSIYPILSLSTEDSGSYSVLVSNPESSMLSGNGELLVGSYPPQILAQPSSLSRLKGEPFMFYVLARGTSPIYYQWFKNSVPIAEATNAIFGRVTSLASDAGTYFVIISNTLDVVTSDLVTLELTNAPVALLGEPSDLSLIQGDTATFTVAVTGTDPVFQWFNSDVLIPDATNATFSITNVQLSDRGLYSVRITNVVNSVFTRAALLSVSLPLPWIAYNDHAPGNLTHSNATRYHVFGNGAPASGPLRSMLNGTNLAVTLTMTRSASGVTANDTAGTPAQGTPVDNVFGGVVDFGGNPSPSIEVAGAGLVTYTFNNLNPAVRYRFHGSAVRGSPDYTDRWAVCTIVSADAYTPAHSSNVLTAATMPGFLIGSEAALNTGANHTSSTGDYVSWDNIQPAANGSFAITCRQYVGPVPDGYAGGSKGYALNALRLAEISTNEFPLTIQTQPRSQTVYVGQSAGFTADVIGYPIFYQWLKDGQPIEAATNRVLSIPDVSTNDTAFYSLIVSNNLNSVTSSNAWLSVIVPQIIEWGRDDYGQVDVPYSLSNVVMMAAGSWHGLALQADGSIIGWGRNLEGQVNIPPDVKNPVLIAAGYQFSMALLSNQTIRCWGDNYWGQCTPPANLTNVVMIAPGYDHAMALKADGTVVAWGRNSYGQSTVPAGLSNVVAVFAGGYSSFALLANGTVSAWGLNDNGQLSMPPGLSNIVALAPGNLHTLALTSDGRVRAWGNNGYGQTTVPDGLSNVVAIAVGGGYSGSHSLALKDDGTVVPWGYNNFGQTTLPTFMPKAARIAGGEYYTAVLNAADPTSTGPVLLPSPFAIGVLGQPFQHRFAVRNGPVSFTASGLPPQLALDVTSGLISGVPLTVGTFTATVSVTNSLGADERLITIIVQSNTLPPVVIDPWAFPLSANQRGTIYCLENDAITYDVYLPPAYSTNGTPLPILYTFNPNGGGMVGEFQSVCASLNIIVIGITGSRNGIGWEPILRECYAVSRDLRQRLLFDPTAEFASGFSGGGVVSFQMSRFRAQHVSGVFGMAGWLGEPLEYPTTDRVLTNLLVARSTGDSDAGANYYLVPDSNYLSSCGAIIKDWFFTGGHSSAPDSIKSAALSWLLNQRIPAHPNDRSDSLVEAATWRSRLAAGQRESVFRECVTALMNTPRSWRAFQAQLILDDIMANYSSFRPLSLDNLAQGDFASDLFYWTAFGAVNAADQPRYLSALKALTGLTGTSGDRAADIHTLLTQYGYPSPILQSSLLPAGNGLRLSILKDTPGLDYTLKSQSSLLGEAWHDISILPVETPATWSVELGIPLETTNTFFRLWTQPFPGFSLK